MLFGGSGSKSVSVRDKEGVGAEGSEQVGQEVVDGRAHEALVSDGRGQRAYAQRRSERTSHPSTVRARISARDRAGVRV